MTFWAYQGTLSVPAATGEVWYPGGQDLKAILYWSNGLAAGDGAHAQWGFGVQSWLAGADAAALSYGYSNNVATTAPASGSTGFYGGGAPTIAPSPAIAPADADLWGMSATQFDLRWTYVSGVTGVPIHYLAVGGDECSVQSKSITARTTTGNQVVTGVGFTPKLVIFIYGGDNTRGGYGAASASTARWACSMSYAAAAVMTSTALVSRIQDTTKCIHLLATGGATTTFVAADLVSMDADGFTLNWTTASSTTFNLRYIAFGGAGQFATGTFTKNANTTDTTQSISAGFSGSPTAGYMIFGNGATNSTAQSTGWRQSIGGSDGTRYNSSCAEVRSASINTQSRRYQDGGGANTVLRQRALPASVSAAGANEVILDHGSFNTGGFVLDYLTNAVTTQYIYPWIAFAPTATPTNDPYGSAIMATSGLLHYWRFDQDTGNMLDYKGTAHLTPTAGVLRGRPSLANLGNDAFGIPASGSTESGTDRVTGTCADAAGSSPANWSLEFWANIPSNNVDGFASLAAAQDFSEQYGWRIGWDGSSQYKRTGVYFGSSGWATYNMTLADLDKWHHFVGTWDGTWVRWYIDGVKRAESNAGTYTPNGTTIAFGGHNASTTRCCKGSYDEAAWYNVALSQATITDHYLKGRGAPSLALAGPVDAFDNAVID